MNKPPHPLAHKAKKRFGQNFLQDPHIIDRIVSAIAPTVDDNIIEIGPGLGALTSQLLPLCERMHAIELDRDIIPKLRVNCATLGELTIHETDVLKFDFNQLSQSGERLTVVGNLPYNISTPILFHILNYATIIDDMVFMVQKEVAERITAQPGNKDYGRLSIMLQYYCETQFLFIVPPESFTPAPKVDSAIIRLIPHKELPYRATDEKLFAKVVTQAFSQRRKTLRNTLKKMVTDDIWQTTNIDPTLRPENLSIKQFVCLANALTQMEN